MKQPNGRLSEQEIERRPKQLMAEMAKLAGQIKEFSKRVKEHQDQYDRKDAELAELRRQQQTRG